MAKTLVQSLGPAGTPHEVKQLRQSSYDLHQQIGAPVILKHRWTKKDVDAGLTTLCPNHDDLYSNRDITRDEICFGTGYVGGYADAQIIFVTLQDAPEAAIKITEQGILSLDLHPAITAPWTPTLQDGDLIITAAFEEGDWQVTEEYERYVLRDVTPITMRGPGWGRQGGSVITRQIISQNSQADKLPPNHYLYQVPLVFDYSNVPSDITPPWGQSSKYTEAVVGVHIHGILPGDEPIETPGTETSVSVGVHIHGTALDPGSTIIF